MSDALSSFLLRERPERLEAPDLRSFWAAAAPLRARFSATVDRAAAAAFVADRTAFAFASGYDAAVHALVPGIPAGQAASFSVTEATGNHPRSIATRLETAGATVVLTGQKRWATFAPLADVIVVVATTGESDGRPLLRAVAVPRGAHGLTVTEMPPTPFVPEVPHAELDLARVELPADAVLPGDGFTDYTKAFRTVEDLHVNAAVLGYLLGVALRFDFPRELAERYAALVATARWFADRDPRAAETHVALAGWLSDVARAVTDGDGEWTRVGDAERDRWYRNRMLVQVAQKARDQRRERAWQELLARSPT